MKVKTNFNKWSTIDEIIFIKKVGSFWNNTNLSHKQHVINYSQAIKNRKRWGGLDKKAILDALELELQRQS